MAPNIRNLDYIHSQDPKLYETLSDIIQAHENTSLQANLNGSGWPAPPPQIHGLQVAAANGHFQVSITDHNPLFRDVHYYVEHADNPNFTDAHVVHMGHSRNYSMFLGNTTRYFRAYSSYATSPPGDPVYHGGTKPAAVSGGGAIQGPKFLKSQSSGTGTPGQGLTGPGIVAFRGGPNGRAPNRHILEPTALAGQPGGTGGGMPSGGGGGGGGISSPLTTKGDIWVYGTTDTRLPVGANGQVLTADSTQPLGLKWANAGGSVTGETPTGTINGTNTAFTLLASPNPMTSLMLFLNGVEQLAGTDYTLSGNTITYTVAPLAGDWQEAYYGVGGVGFAGETPTGTINGTNTGFTLSTVPSPSASLMLFLNGVEQLAGTDYTLSGNIITYAVAPATGDWHRAYYGMAAVSSANQGSIGITIDGGGTVPATGLKGSIQLPWNATITGWSIAATDGITTGSASVDIWYLAGSAPPAAPPVPAAANKISASAPVALAGASSAAGGTSAIATWTSLALGQYGAVSFNLASISTVTRITVELLVTKS